MCDLAYRLPSLLDLNVAIGKRREKSHSGQCECGGKTLHITVIGFRFLAHFCTFTERKSRFRSGERVPKQVCGSGIIFHAAATTVGGNDDRPGVNLPFLNFAAQYGEVLKAKNFSALQMHFPLRNKSV